MPHKKYDLAFCSMLGLLRLRCFSKNIFDKMFSPIILPFYFNKTPAVISHTAQTKGHANSLLQNRSQRTRLRQASSYVHISLNIPKCLCRHHVCKNINKYGRCISTSSHCTKIGIQDVKAAILAW